MKRPLLVTWIQERPQQPGPSGPWCTTAPSVPLMREVAPLSPRSPASHPPTQRPLLWPPFSVSLWFSKGSRLCPEAEREAGVLEAWEPLFSVSCGQRGAQESGSHSPRGVYPGGTQSHGGTQEVVWAALGFPLIHGVCAFPFYTAQAPGCSVGELSKLGPGLHARPRSKPLRFRFSGTPQRHRLSWACVLCPSQV